MPPAYDFDVNDFKVLYNVVLRSYQAIARELFTDCTLVSVRMAYHTLGSVFTRSEVCE